MLKIQHILIFNNYISRIAVCEVSGMLKDQDGGTKLFVCNDVILGLQFSGR
jgi:hypothetical protein